MPFIDGLKTVFGSVSEIIYPDHCQICQAGLLGTERFVCLSCGYDLPYIEQNSNEQSKLSHLFAGRVEVAGVFSLFDYQKGKNVPHLLHQLKYHGKQKLGVHFGKLLGEKITSRDIDLIVPVPLHPRRQRQRGYNQSLLIARGIDHILQTGVGPKVLRRKSWSFSQTKFTKYDRWENVRSIFEVRNTEKIKGRHVLLVDDVLTTGATVEACARELLKAEGCKVSVATLAARL